MTREYEQPIVVDMEGAALYQVAYFYKIPILSIKVVSDIIGMKDHLVHYKKFEQDQGAIALRIIYQTLFERK
jgi:adenosylhomocysteine nucleosidase